MKGWKENLTESMNNAYERRSNHLGIKIFMYVIIVFIAFIFTRMLIHFNIFYIESDSAEYLLSALVQSEAAIIGIVITLTFITVQLIFSYAPQAVAVALKRNYDMWLLLIFYAISIFYGLFVLRMIPNEWNGSLGQLYFSTLWGSPVSLEYRICFAYCLGVSAFVAIAPYILNTVYFLKPANIIKILSRDITEYKILRHIKSVEEHKKDRTIPVEEDPFQPIMSIIHGSVMKYDITTVRCGLEAVIKKAVDIIYLYKYSDDEDIPMYFCDHLGRAGRSAMRAGDDESAIEIIGCLKNIGILAIEMPSDKAAKIAAQYIEMIGTFAAEKKLRFVTCDAVTSLKVLGILAAKNRLKDTTLQATDSLGSVGMYAAENKIGIATQNAAKYLGRVGKCAAENELGNAAEQAADSLGVVGEYAAENELKYATSEAARSLGLIGSVATEEKLEKVVNQVVESLGSVGRVAMVNELEDAAWQATSRLGFVGEVAAEKEFTDAAEQAASHLGLIGRVAAVNRFERVANEAAKSIGSIGKVAVVEELAKRSVVMRAIESLGFVGEVAAKQGLKNATLEAARQLGLVGKVAVEKGLEFKSAVEQVIESLRFVGEIAVGNNRLKDTIFQVAFRFVSIGIVATEKELKFAAHRAARCLAELTISSKEIVENAIKFNRLGLEENDREFFDKFRDTYEQYRKEL